jgi:hypothetical protein
MKILKILMVLFFLFISSSAAYAHPPSDIALTYDSASKTLTAVITHNVSNPVTHHIYKVEVGLNNSIIITQMISRQDNNLNQTVKYYILDAKAGDTLSVDAYCNLSGDLKKEIKAK